VKPLRNNTTLKQEHATFLLFKQLTQGKDIPREHQLRKLHLSMENSKGWGMIPKVCWEFGQYDFTVKQVYNSFLRVGASGARGAVITLSITDGSLCGLIRRYSTGDEMVSVWNWPTCWTACVNYKHDNCNVTLSATCA
jgi:hypothetical protein